MWLVAAIVAALGQDPCIRVTGDARTLMNRMDGEGAVARLRAADAASCDVAGARAFLTGLVAARAAVASGGDEAALAPVRGAIVAIEALAAPGSPEEIALLTLRAAVAAAQSERDELAVYLAQALQVERARSARGLGGAPIITAHEVAGELWLQVYRFDDAIAAFRVARAAFGDTPRLTAGLARSLAGARQAREACEEYRRLAPVDAGSGPLSGEVAAARAYLRRPDCAAGAP